MKVLIGAAFVFLDNPPRKSKVLAYLNENRILEHTENI
jgi:hypothetical protein